LGVIASARSLTACEGPGRTFPAAGAFAFPLVPGQAGGATVIRPVAPVRVRSAYGDMTNVAASGGSPRIAGVDQGRDGEPGASGHSCQDDLRRGRAVAQGVFGYNRTQIFFLDF
jgi:hypothetical protein